MFDLVHHILINFLLIRYQYIRKATDFPDHSELELITDKNEHLSVATFD